MASNSGKARRYSVWQRMYYRFVPFRYRYDSIFRKTFDFLMESQSWSRQKLLDYQFRELSDLLEYSYNHVPYYTRVFNERGLKPSDIRSPDDMKKLPVLTKKLVRENHDALISTIYTGKRVTFKTSGSTGEKLIIEGDDSVFKKEAAFILRSFKEHGGDLYDKPSVWIRRYVPKEKDQPLWYYDYELKRLYMSAYHITKETVRSYVDAINETKSDMLVGYPSSVYILAKLVEEEGLSLPYIKSAHVTSEMMLDHWKSEVEKILGISVYAHYGQIERVAFMYQPEKGTGYYDDLEYGFTEFVSNSDGDHDIIGTGFVNRVMPLIRYNTGDTAILFQDDKTEKGLPLSVRTITGRTDDILIAKSGARLPGVNFYSMLSKVSGLKMFQLIQRSLGTLDVHMVIDKECDKKIVTENVRAVLMSRLGDVDFLFKEVPIIERDPRTQKIRCIQCFI